MNLLRIRHNFIVRKRLERLLLDLPDAAWRRATGRGHWPPYSLRAFVGGARDFDQAGRWFAGELARLGLLTRETRLLDVGCGCGRLAYPLATDEPLRELGIRYQGMDIDPAAVRWCRRHITPRNPGFRFDHADVYNRSYHPRGARRAEEYAFPYPDASFDLILLTSVFTHLLEPELRNYLSEVSRLLAPGGVAYASFFLFNTAAEAAEGSPRHGIRFPFARGNAACNREDFEENAVAYPEPFIRDTAAALALGVVEPVAYGTQDIVIFEKQSVAEPRLGSGWHALEEGRWRWTERVFEVALPPLPEQPWELRFRFFQPDAAVGVRRLTAWAQGEPLASAVCDGSGEYLLAIRLDTLAGSRDAVLRFELDQAIPGSSGDTRELGVQVAFHAPPPLQRRLQPFVLGPSGRLQQGA